MYPIKLKPVFKDYIWGGTKLKNNYGKISDLPKIAESWELVCNKDEQSIVANGSLLGLTLSQVIQKWGPDCLGENCRQFEYFPIMIKLIDSNKQLSIQVHPDDEYARKKAGEYGKTEMWYIAEADDNASIIYGFNKEITKDEVKQRLKDNTLTDVLNIIPVKKGDSFMVNAGMVHAIGKGIVVAEIQQNSNITYRLFDYNRKDANGNLRELHVEDALNVLTFDKSTSPAFAPTTDFTGYTVSQLTKCKYFTVEKYETNSGVGLCTGKESFHAVTILEGNGYLEQGNDKYEFVKGDTIFIPALLGDYALNGSCTFLLSRC
ncbi:MAG: class I mannose-6-phosphate isomerase [Clostridiaceae bacterium]|nr:class I mannose-6-phosphate isomerase [Clostridiaceae bacterium]